MTWTRVPSALTYEVVIDNNGDFSSPEFTSRTANNTVVPTTNLRTGTNHWRVRAFAGSEASDWSTSTFDPGPVGVPQAVSPANGEPLKQPEDPPLLTWGAVHGATEYIVEVDRDVDFIGAGSYTTKTTSLVVPDPLGAGTWHWRVKASRGTGLVSEPSSARTFQILPIDVPTLISPANDANTQIEDVVLDWKPVPGAKSYEVQVANNETFTNITETRIGILGTKYSPAKGYNNDQYYWRVRAIDLGGTATPWAESQFNFKRQWPDRPWPVFPMQDGFTTTPDTVNHDPFALPNKIITTPAPYFQWTPVQHASHYQLDVSTDANFSTFASCRIAGTTYTPGNAVHSDTSMSRGSEEDCLVQEGSQMFWRVRPMDAPFNDIGFFDGIQGIYSPTQRFTWDPVYFSGLSPMGGVTVAVPTFSWTPGVAAEKYKVEIFKSGAASPIHTKTTYATSYTPVDLELKPADGPFTWRLSALEAGGRSSALVSNTFNVSGTTPTSGAPALTALSGRASDPATMRAPSLTWEPLAGASYYRVSIGDDDGTNFYWIPTSDESFDKKSYFPAFTETGKRVLRPGAYKWVVEAYDATNLPIGVSAVNVFRIANFPAVTGQTIALDGKTLDAGAGCDLALVDAGAFCDGVPATPVLSWDQSLGMSSYVVYTSQDANFTNLTELTRIPNTWNTRYAFTFSNKQPALPDNESGVPYYWHIRPCKAIAVCGPDPVSASTSRATNAFLKTSPKVALSSPGDTAPVDTHEVTFDWADYFDTNQSVQWQIEKSPQSGKWYRLQVDDNSNFSTPIDDIKVDQSTYTAFTKLYPEGTLHWRVGAIDGADNELNWSQPRTFVKSSPRLALTSPLPGSTVSGVTPFRWDSQAFASEYVVEVYKDEDTTFSTTNRMFSAKVRTAAYAWTSPLPPSPKPYVWRVRRIDSNGNEGPWSTTGRFTVDGGTLTLASPADGAAQPPNGPVMAWNPLLGAAKYRVEIFALATGQNQTPVTTVATSYAPTSIFATGTYRWSVTALDPNNNALTTAARTFTVDAGLTATSPPAIAAPVSSAIGQTLTSTPPVWNQPDVSNVYQWLRDGSPISGATSSTYTMVASDYTKQISLRVTGKKPGYTDGVTISNAIGVTAGGALQNTSPPTISGSAIVGSSLMTTAGTWSEASPVLRYQWLRAGAPIPNAKSSSYRLTTEDAGKGISVTVFASKTGFNEGSASTAPVTVARLTSTTVATLSRTRVKPGKRVKIGITVTVPGVAGPVGMIKVFDGAKKLKTLTLVSARDGKIGWRLPKLKKGKHKIKAVYLGNNSTAGSKSKRIKLYVVR
ncbi:Ig-like domain repeat protein [Nocardioides allogilvus]|uniref:Ig-like domain repeat protein n=1 Tax=Nocardioides allogilvus TaxID=2072017 RepID=UPI000D303334|nr:Ig-like domain repeat protein [Nocardioides allogilvus]